MPRVFCKVGESEGGVRLKDFVCHVSYVQLIIGGGGKLHDVIGCCRTKPEFLLEVGMGDSQRTRSTQNVRTSSKWPPLIAVQ